MAKTTLNNSIMEELLASQKTKFKSLSRNQEIEGSIVAINDREITLDLGAKSEGVLPIRELPEDLKLGSKIKVYVVMVENEHGQIVVSLSPQLKIATFRGRGINWQKFSQALNQKSKLTGKVLEINKGGLIVEVFSSRGFLPNSQVGFELLSKAEKGMEDLVGQTITVTVSEINQNNNKLIFSQRGQVSDQVKEKIKEFKKDQTVSGKIVAILPFGLVVDVSGMEGLVFISDVSWEKVDDLSKKFEVGQTVEGLVLGVDEDLGRLNLSMKHLMEDPFLKASRKYKGDDVIKGEVVSVSDSGVVIKLEDGVEGILPLSKIDQTTSYQVGSVVSVLIDSVDSKRRKITLAPMVTSTAGLIYK